MGEELNPNGIHRSMMVRYTGKVARIKDPRCYERGRVSDLYTFTDAGGRKSQKASVCFAAYVRLTALSGRCPSCYSYDVRNLVPIEQDAVEPRADRAGAG